jgi:hypothetical protein
MLMTSVGDSQSYLTYAQGCIVGSAARTFVLRRDVVAHGRNSVTC